MAGPRVREGTLAKVYEKHLKNVKTVAAKIDNSAPRLPVAVYVKEAKYYADIARLRNLDVENRGLIKRINTIYRIKGRVDCKLERYSRQRTIYSHEAEAVEKQQRRNAKFLQKLDSKFVKSEYNQEYLSKDWKKMLKAMKFSAKYPEFYDIKPSRLESWSLCPPNVSSDPASHQVCYLDLKIGDLPQVSRLEIEVYSDIVPATAANFVALCQGFGKLGYKGSPFHRIVPNLFCIGGDVVNHSGTGGMSIYGASFPDENFTLQHNGPGVVAMYSSTPDNNNSQFLITFKQLVTLNGKFVVIGRVKKGFKVLRMIESCGTKGGKPLGTVKVVKSGVYKENKKETISTPISGCQGL
ncbi:peptidyl-prolyl cis-trans isomerase F, mitochondrial-like [Macrosteles quadrilineatus]|uniref:peptidyl-prolyl cis-trans isomerase F, mitochondrial-like n=1 Tax=Macrosteles quadrilineatus TaxID=74068 RepID=UPI0023E1D43A|nr:peptidyl-prolyl cis-trans isomerase F, mitochondrial-like [Macrosteles quadrilineatus]